MPTQGLCSAAEDIAEAAVRSHLVNDTNIQQVLSQLNVPQSGTRKKVFLHGGHKVLAGLYAHGGTVGVTAFTHSQLPAGVVDVVGMNGEYINCPCGIFQANA